jgi:histidyl-tRNA synthetase
MKIQSPPGMRDFFPEDMRLQNWLFDRWRDVSLQFGFEEYEGPIFESLELFTAKSGDEIVSQLFNFEDRGGRQFAIRPEMTPTLARMVAARANALPRPIKWFSLPRMCRAERPQRGRLREFFQWNVDILGIEDVLADAEVIAVGVSFLKSIGLSPDEVRMHYSSRPLAAAVLDRLGLDAEQTAQAFALIDRLDKVSADDFAKQWTEALGSACDPARVLELFQNGRWPEIKALLGDSAGELIEQMESLRGHLEHFGASDYCEFDLQIVRGLAYYTGPVFEAKMRGAALRSLFGGGRYDNLTELLGGPKVTGVGFGAGDAPLFECLKELDRLPELSASIDAFVIDADREAFAGMLEVVGQLRSAGCVADFSYKRQAVGKQFKQASQRQARFALVIGQETREQGLVALKDLTQGEQQTVSVARAIAVIQSGRLKE